jgi:hypothetical protein
VVATDDLVVVVERERFALAAALDGAKVREPAL